MKNLTPELIAKAKAAKSAEELLEIAKANGVELTAEEAKTYFAQLNANGAVSDDELDVVAGGCGESYKAGTEVKFTDGTVCPKCKSPFGIVTFDPSMPVGPGSRGTYVRCAHCKTTISNSADGSRMEAI
jgi:predicted ribosomally synthesized peptide with nif11-like leader